MQPRMIFRTHYQVDEPAYMEFLVKLCTSPTQSAYPEIVAQRLAQEIRTRCKKFNEAAGRYAVGLGLSLGVINPNNVWTDKGFLINLVAEIQDGDAETQLSLTLPEKLLHLRIFLEADGAILLYLARHLADNRSLPSGDRMNEFARDMFLGILTDYLNLSTNTAERLSLRREIDRIRGEGYRGNSGSHKLFVHLQTLYRVGLVTRSDATSRVYSFPKSQGDEGGLTHLAGSIPNLMALEKAIASHSLVEIAGHTLRIPHISWDDKQQAATSRLIAQFYSQVDASGVALCPISTLIEAVQIRLLAEGILFNYSQAESLLTELQRRHSKEIRFHVDRRGQLAYIKISPEVINSLLL